MDSHLPFTQKWFEEKDAARIAEIQAAKKELGSIDRFKRDFLHFVKKNRLEIGIISPTNIQEELLDFFVDSEFRGDSKSFQAFTDRRTLSTNYVFTTQDILSGNQGTSTRNGTLNLRWRNLVKYPVSIYVQGQIGDKRVEKMGFRFFPYRMFFHDYVDDRRVVGAKITDSGDTCVIDYNDYGHELWHYVEMMPGINVMGRNCHVFGFNEGEEYRN